ncbi:hypothetical protein PB2503_05437 [Parvularcula bermudensis HTCC2503]|uniref:N-acetyltransferase domain-containing protein n=1 Tax=Parvularcula bermudensis (strain ATCC BAA-594 / HTCC2503 / KCTC 12087) TaxID=314260 RepID=E0TGB8_PARBH|nr:hypothetical protein [Parvularcula bermudensis]ADM09161.1 hypothetical protein PB2503_05437 [Parvularcula bermudensis HTCC2503]
MTLTTYEGEAITPYLSDLADLRIRVFREWPYLYEGDRAYEEDYLKDFATASHSLLILLRGAGEEIVGASTGAALTGHHDGFSAPFADYGYDPLTVFYCAESVLLPPYRGKGWGHRFFDEREAHARRQDYAHCAFCAVIRDPDHPARPADYRPLDGFWRKRGYRPIEGLTADFAWKDVGETEETTKSLQYWLKPLA